MSHRTQLTLTDEQYERLSALASASGMSLSELVRRALDRTYAYGGREGLTESFGAWKGRREDGAAYVERLRLGLAKKLDGNAGPG